MHRIGCPPCHRPGDCAPCGALSELSVLQLPARLCPYLREQSWGPCGTSALGQSVGDTRQSGKHSGLIPQRGEGLGVLLQVLGCRLSIFHLSAVPAAQEPGGMGGIQVGWWDPGRMSGHAKVHFLGRSSLKHILSLCTSSSGTSEADALRTVCDGEPAPGCSACEQPPVRCPEVQPLHPPEHPRKRVVSAPRYSCLYISSGLKKCPSPALHPKDAQRACPGCTAPTRIWDPGTWDPLWRARDGREQWGHLPSCRPSRG